MTRFSGVICKNPRSEVNKKIMRRVGVVPEDAARKKMSSSGVM